MKKRILAAFMAAVLALSLALPTLAAGVSGSGSATRSVVSGECGDALTWELDLGTGVMTISGTGEMYDYSSSDNHWGYRNNIRSVVVEEGVTYIGAYAFQNCYYIGSIELPSSLTGFGEAAFLWCYALGSIEIPEGITSIPKNTFNGCTGLTSVTLPSSLDSIGEKAFAQCQKLTSIELPEGLTTIGKLAFGYGCGLKSLEIPASVTSIGDNAFDGCAFMTATFKGEPPTSFGSSVFGFNCLCIYYLPENASAWAPNGETQWNGYELRPYGETVSISGVCGDDLVWTLDTTGLLTISGTGDMYDYPEFSQFGNVINSAVIEEGCTGLGEGAFYDFEALTSVETPSSLTSIGSNAFGYCYSLTSAELHDGLTSIGEGAFSSCITLASITLPSSVTSIGDYAFNGCSSLTSAVFAGEPPADFGSEVFDWCGANFCIYYMPELADVWAPNGESGWNGYPILPYGQTYDPDHIGGVCGENLTWTLDVPAGELTITGTGAMYDYEQYGAPWCGNSLTSIELPEGLTHIGSWAFNNCGWFTSVDLPASLTSIGDHAFDGCSLNSIDLPAGLTSVGDYAFYHTGITSLTLPSGLTSVGAYAFYWIPITSLEIPASLTSIGALAFGRLTNLTSLVLPESMTSIGAYVFGDCSALTSVELPPNLTSIGEGAFRGCSRLSSLTLPDGVTSIGADAFNGCALISSLELPAGVTSIGNYAFKGCGFASATFMGEPPTEFGSNVFPAGMICIYYQPELASSWSPNGETEWNGYPIFPVGEAGSVSGICGDDLVWTLDTTGLLTISGTGDMYDYQEGQTPWYGRRSVINSIIIEEGATKIGEEAFDGCIAVTSVQLPSTVTYIGPWAFQTTNIASIELPAGLTFLGDGAFYGCTALESIVIPDGVTSIGEYAFWQCTALESIELPDGITSIGGYAFCYCSALTSIEIPDGVTSIGNYAFRQCTALGSIELPDGLTSMGEGVFAQCSALTSVVIPDGVTSIPQYAFYQCSALASVDLPAALTSLGQGAFYLCSSLPTIEIPAGVTNVSDSAFAGCYALSSAYFLGEPPTGSNIFYACASDFCIYYLAEHVGTWSPNGETTWKGYPIVMLYDPENPPVFTVTFVDSVNGKTIMEMEVALDTVLSESDFPEAPVHNKYEFAGWDYDGTAIRGDRTITANYTRTYEPGELATYDFESQEDADLWTAVDSDGDGYNWFWATDAGYAYSGSGFMASESWNNNPLTPDNWLISPAFEVLGAGASVSMYLRGYDPYYLDDHFAVYAGTSTDLADMVEIIPEAVVTDSYVMYSANLSSFAGQTVYIAVRHFNCTDMYWLLLDHVELFAGDEPTVYTVTFTDGFGNVLSTQEVEELGAAAAPEEPTHTGYTFAGWDADFSCIESDLTVNATWSINTYTVTWVNDDGTVLETDANVPYGTTPTYDGATPTKPATAQYTYTFDTWSPAVAPVEGNVTYTATYTSTVNTYTVTWVNEDGTVLETDANVPYGTTPTYDGATPTKPATAQYTYTFDTWSPAVAPVEGDVTYTATFTSTVNTYTVTWVNEDGTVLETDENVPYGTTPTYDGATPTKPATAQYTYTFAGWNPAIAPVEGDATYTATFTSTVNTYTVTWVNEDGTVLETDENVPYGTTPTYDGATPTKPATAQYTYTFAGWDPEVTAVTGDATYTATFTSTVNTYTVTWVNEDGTVLETDENVPYGTTPTYDGATPTKPATAQYTYTFAGWNPAIAPVEGDATYTATYTSTVNTYTVTWVNEDGTVLEIDENVPYGTTPTYDDVTPTKPATAQYTYTFAGWTPEIVPVEGDATYTATFTAIVNVYIVTFVDGLTIEVLAEVEVEYGAAATAPEAPEHEGYTFVGWDIDFDFITEDIVVVALYEENIIPGDADGDGSVTIADALIALRGAMGLIELTPEQLEACDMNGDGQIDISDALYILRLSMGLITD